MYVCMYVHSKESVRKATDRLKETNVWCSVYMYDVCNVYIHSSLFVKRGNSGEI